MLQALLPFITIGSLALDAGSSIFKGFGDKASQDFMAQRDARAAELGRLKADQTDVHLREELNTTLANIDVIRTAGGADPLSPTSLAVKAEEARIGDRERTTRVAAIRAQADEDEATAAYRKQAGKYALLGGYVGAGAKVLGGIGKMKG